MFGKTALSYLAVSCVVPGAVLVHSKHPWRSQAGLMLCTMAITFNLSWLVVHACTQKHYLESKRRADYFFYVSTV